jgi:hypothetical protein
MIPNFHLDPLSFEESVKIIQNRGDGDLLEGMKAMDRMWAEYVALPGDEQDDFEFFGNWCYECNAYNVVYENMSKLFAPKEAA